jgi:DNA helicase HerA-like ATPase
MARQWVAQLIGELNRFAARRPASVLQALVMFDEADLYLPANRQPATKAPMESLLKRARSAGLGVMLATQSPGDLDYRCRENVLTWLIGRIKEPTALEKLRPLAGSAGIDPSLAFPKQSVGQFHVITDDKARAFQAERSLMDTEQLSERQILVLAQGSAPVWPTSTP